jgi:zinc/manganese transport system substrate-binding protein
MNRQSTWIWIVVCFSALCLPLLADDGKLKVVATTPDFGAIARAIGSNRVEVTVFAQPAEDPHFVTPKPSYIAKLSRADVLIEGGAELELGWLPPLLDGARNPKLALGQPGHIACAEGLALLEVPHTADRSRGDIHAMGNPHYMTDPAFARHAAERISEAFSKVDGKSAAFYQANLAAFTNRLSIKLVEWQKVMEPHKGKRIVAYHNSWPYFTDRFGLKNDIFLEPKPGIPPSPAHLAEVVTTMKAENIGVIIDEPYQNRKTAETVADRTGATIVSFTQYPGGVKGTEAGYIELIDYLVNSLATALQKSGASKAQKQ